MNLKLIQDKIAEVYYHHGLFCASHPYSILFICIAIILSVCYPLTKLPLPGNTPLQHVTPVSGYTVPPKFSVEESKGPFWYYDKPLAYVQQIVVKTAVSPWQQKDHIPIDAFRAPLSTVFDVVRKIDNFQVTNGSSSRSLGQLCLRVTESVDDFKLSSLLPQYDCLVISPANFWHRDASRFIADSKIMKTVYSNYGSGINSAPFPKDILFGLPWMETGISKYFIRNKQRIITYAISIVFKSYDASFIAALKSDLHVKYPYSEITCNGSSSDMVHFHFKNRPDYMVEYNPLIITYFILFLYIYFSVRKIEMVKSKWGLAVSAVLTVTASLFMSISICSFFGLTPSLNGGEIFPYLVVVVGMENVIVLTKSVVSTPLHYDVKIRVAQGLSKEGWSITKNLLTELAILFVGFFTFVPAIQEFCLFAFVGVLTDFFLQMVFFATTLSIDIRRMELSDLQKTNIMEGVQEDDINTNLPLTPPSYCPVLARMTGGPPASAMLHKVPSTAQLPTTPLTSHALTPSSPPPSPANMLNSEEAFHSPYIVKTRRLKMMYFWARTRVVQRMIMVCTVIWILLIVYKAGLLHHLARRVQASMYIDTLFPKQAGTTKADTLGDMNSEVSSLLYHTDGEPWRKLSYKHWPTLLSYYNISVLGRYISILPTIHLSTVVSPQQAIQMRHPSEQAAYRDPDDPEFASSFQDGVKSHPDKVPRPSSDLSPPSSFELFISVVLGVLSTVVIIYFMMALYRCMCSRSYAKWRSSWYKGGKKTKVSQYVKQIKESVPLLLKGHAQELECVVTEGQMVISSCLGGQIRVWDSNTGECLTEIYRKCATPPGHRIPCLGRNINDSDADLYAEYHEMDAYLSKKDQLNSIFTSPSQGQNLNGSSIYQRRKQRFADVPDLSFTIDTNFITKKTNSGTVTKETKPKTDASVSSDKAYDFASKFEPLYAEHRQLLEEAEAYERRKALMFTDAAREKLQEQGAGDSTGVPHDQLYEGHFTKDNTPAIWCLTSYNGLIMAGCGNGRIEFWDSQTGALKCLNEEGKIGITHVCFHPGKNRVLVARLDGKLDFFELETFISQSTSIASTAGRGCLVKSPHARLPSGGSGDLLQWQEVIHCKNIYSIAAHQQPVNALVKEGVRAVTASQDHTLKVFNLDIPMCLFTLHGHTAGVTALHLRADKSVVFAVSGSEDGSVRIWNLETGSCVHKLCRHTSTVTTLTSTSEYVISAGLDDKLCIWERRKGQLLHSIQVDPGYCNTVAMLTNKLLVSGGQGCLLLWDAGKGDIIKSIRLGDYDYSVFVRQVSVINNASVVCDYANELRVVHFPSVLEKAD